MNAFVIDVSACMPWCCEDEATAESEQLLHCAAQFYRLHVPSLWPWEMTNALAVAVRRQRIKQEQASDFLELLASFDFCIAESPSVADLADLGAFAARCQLTAYDAAYLHLAKQLDLPLATLDDALRKAALAEGVTLL
jgi:predicted nucleic acid-binding protein